ncbi:MAG: hypothetical protein KF832_29785 [Caldilineaceae bacterium]|nr:hypothetical protein [Caldilineaceae bacterium]
MSLSKTATLVEVEAQTKLQNFGRATLADFFGDMVIYRNLEPLEKKLPGLKSAGYRMGLTNDAIPRKFEPGYAKAALWFAEEAQRLRRVSVPLREMLFIGDTLLNDGQAYRNLLKLSGWQSACFIGADRLEQKPSVEIDEKDRLYNANRWFALGDWIESLAEQGFRLDQQTVFIVDIDKTLLGAKGRNDAVIDKARLDGIYQTMDAVLGEDFDRTAFEKQYSTLNRSRYHSLTADNQDYLAYICLVLNTGLIRFEELLSEIENDSLKDFEQLIRWVDSRLMSRGGITEAFRQVHEAVRASQRIGDPTPFKQFRREEFVSTVSHMGNMADDASVEQILAEEITLTEEICQLAESLKARGCLLLCFSDKPYEASCPTRQLAANFLPVHRMTTHRIGISIADKLRTLR